MMKKLTPIVAVIVIILLAMPLLGAAPEKERKIVVFKDVVSPEKKAEIVKQHGGERIDDLQLINGQSIMLPPGKTAALANTPEVLLVEEDAVAEVQGKPGKIIVQPAQSLPWGIDRVDAEQCWASYTGDPVRVAIVDTGIDTSHPDLVSNLKGGASLVSYTSSYNDDNGHGSHVAGIIGAANNAIGVVGVGPSIDLYAVKVLDRKGKGYISDIIKGLEWCISNQIQVVNMSLGAKEYSQSLADAVIKVNAAGIVQVAAAGNENSAVLYPAALPEVIAVAATDSTDTRAYFSNYGSQVDLAAPGVSILSTYKGSAYATMSGTSMATPHVTGAAALLINSGKAVTPGAVQSLLEASAVDLGPVGKDNYYGSGLVNAFAAINY